MRVKKADLKDLVLSAWIGITSDDLVTVTVSQSEMGQGVYTSIPMIVADELEADWKTVRFRAAPAADEYKNPVWGVQATGGSTSIRHFHDRLRQAGAAGRAMLVQAAAQSWGVPPAECLAEKGVVRHPGSGRSTSYGKLAAAASQLPLPKDPPLKDTRQTSIYRATAPTAGPAGKNQRKGPVRHRHVRSRYCATRPWPGRPFSVPR